MKNPTFSTVANRILRARNLDLKILSTTFFGTPFRTIFKNKSLIRFMHPYEVDENAGVPPDERGTAHPHSRSHPTVRTALFFLYLFNMDYDSLSFSGGRKIAIRRFEKTLS